MENIKLTDKEQMVLNKVKEMGKVNANDLMGQVGELSIHSVRSTLARLDTHHKLLKKSKALVNDKVVSNYELV